MVYLHLKSLGHLQLPRLIMHPETHRIKRGTHSITFMSLYHLGIPLRLAWEMVQLRVEARRRRILSAIGEFLDEALLVSRNINPPQILS